MSKSDLLKELRSLTQAGMKDCLDALKEAKDNLQVAVDIIKSRGQNVVSGRENKIAAEGLVLIGKLPTLNSSCALLMLEVNCETDFVAKSEEFKDFAVTVWNSLADCYQLRIPVTDLTNAGAITAQKEIILKTKEKCIINRWWIEEPIDETCRVFGYVHHPADKLASILTLKAPTVEITNSKEFSQIGNDLAMQVVAMNPIAVSPEHLLPEVVSRQTNIFEAQMKELGKPQAQWGRIVAGKINKWYTEVCLLKQESVVVPKKSIEQLIETQYATLLGGKIEIVNFIRCQVGEGLIKPKGDSFAIEVAKLSNVPAGVCPTAEKGVCDHTHTK